MKKHHPMGSVVAGGWMLFAVWWAAAAQGQTEAEQQPSAKEGKQTAGAGKQTTKAEGPTAKAEKQTAKAERRTAKAEKQADGKRGRSRKAKQPKGKAQEQGDLELTVAMLNSQGREQVEAAIQNLGLLGDPQAVEPLAQRIRRGLPPDLLEVATMTLMALGEASSGPVLFELLRHRRPTVRTRAAEAIAAVNPPGAEQALVQALQDSHADVRAAAATALGEIGARNALSALFRALDRGVFEASAAIGKLVPAEQVGKLLGYLNTIPLYSLGPALREVLGREDVMETAKLEVVARLQEVATSEAKGYLVDFLASSGESAAPTLVRAVERAIQQIAD